MPRRRWHPSSDTKIEIAAEAERQFGLRGYTATTIRDIAGNLGMSPANIFKHFGGKAGLIDYLAAQHIARLDQELDDLKVVDSAAERLRRLVTALVTWHIDKAGKWPNFLEFIASSLVSPPPSAEAFHHRLEGRVEAIVRDGIANGEFAARDPAEAAECACAAMMSAFDPIRLTRELEKLPASEVLAKCARITEFVIGALRMPIVK